jgi:hypothetical protein
MDGQDAGEIEGGAELVAMAEAVVGANPEHIADARDNLVQRLSAAAMIDAAGVASNFQRMVRIADSTGIVLGDFESVTEDLREDLGINRFAKSSA